MKRAVRGIVPLFVCLVLYRGVWSMQDRSDVTGGVTAASMARPAVVAGGFVYVSAVTAAEGAGTTAPPNIDAQTRQVIDRLAAALEGAGSSLAQAVSVSVYLAHASDFDAMNAAYRERFAEAPPVRTTVVADLASGALVQMSAIAVPLGAPREVLHPAGWMKSPRPYSYIVRAGDLVFFSGLLSRRGSDDQVVPGPIGVQVKTILDNTGTLLKTVGLTYRDVVAARVYLVDDSYFEAMNDEYRKYFSTEPPARATAVTGLVGASSLVEISFVASTSEKQLIGPVVAPSLPVSTAVRVGPRVFLSGVVGNTDTNNQDVAGQTREVFTRISRTLELAGLTFGDVVDNTVYMTDLWQAGTVDKIYGEFFQPPAPARSVFGAHMAARASLIEMMMTAVK
jgi:2-iminobutanoate/2-iminopropanoate deaminase